MHVLRRLSVGLIGILALAGCASAEGPVLVAAASDPDPLSAAVDRAIADCFDPLHDSDGSGGFFAFCDRATSAKAVGALDCLDPSYKPGASECAQWRVTAEQVPPYYFDVPPEPDVPVESQPTVPPPLSPPAQQQTPEEVEQQDPAPDEAAESPQENPANDLPPDDDAPSAPTKPEEPDEAEPAGPAVDPTATPDPEPPPPGPTKDAAPADNPSAATSVLMWNDIGGCQMLGDFCIQRTVYADGTVEARRPSGGLVASGSVDIGLVDQLLAATTDGPFGVESLPPGPCRMAADGNDVDLWIIAVDVRFSSCGIDISGDQPRLLRAARILGEAAVAAVPVDWEKLLADE